LTNRHTDKCRALYNLVGGGNKRTENAKDNSKIKYIKIIKHQTQTGIKYLLISV